MAKDDTLIKEGRRMETVKPVRPFDIVFLIPSRGRPAMLTSLIDDIYKYLSYALSSNDKTWCICTYLQGYDKNFSDKLEEECNFPLVIVATDSPHNTMGEVVRAAHDLCNAELKDQTGFSFSDAKIIIMMDDDCTIVPDQRTLLNLSEAVDLFLAGDKLLITCKLGQSPDFKLTKLVSDCWPVMPGKEKMHLIKPSILKKAIDHPRFAELTLAEDIFISTVAWIEDPNACNCVYGIAGFTHLGLEIESEYGGIQDLPEPVKHVTPRDIHTNIFLPTGHPLYLYHGIRPEVIKSMKNHGTQTFTFELW